VDFPLTEGILDHPGIIGSYTDGSLGDVFLLNSVGASAWPAADRAIFVPFCLSEPQLVKKMLWFNGPTVSGNTDAGIFDMAGNRIISTGSVAQAGTSATQIADVTDTLLRPGLFMLAMAADNATGTYRSQSGTNAQTFGAFGLQQAATSFPLPSSVTYANVATGYMPIVAAMLQTV
jgi:hypothetical protein